MGEILYYGGIIDGKVIQEPDGMKYNSYVPCHLHIAWLMGEFQEYDFYPVQIGNDWLIKVFKR